MCRMLCCMSQWSSHDAWKSSFASSAGSGGATSGSATMFPSNDALRATAAAVIELGEGGLLTQPHVDLLCDGIGELSARRVTDWEAAGRAITAVELVAVFGQSPTAAVLVAGPAGARQQQLCRQLVRLAPPPT